MLKSISFEPNLAEMYELKLRLIIVIKQLTVKYLIQNRFDASVHGAPCT